MEQVARRGRVS